MGRKFMMKGAEIIHTRGTVTRYELLVPVTYRVLENTCVAEIRHPYPDYYSASSDQPRPNSLFLFTQKFYSLDELLKLDVERHEFTDDMDVATAVINCADNYHYAIRINNFIYYEYIRWLQQSFAGSGISFLKKINLTDRVSVTVFKCFNLLEADIGIYRDATSANEGYIVTPGRIRSETFSSVIHAIRQNAGFGLFDAAPGTLELASLTLPVIRIYAENIKTGMLQYIRESYIRLTTAGELVEQ